MSICMGADEAPVFKLLTSKPGIYQVSYKALAEKGLEAGRWDARKISLEQGGNGVPLWVNSSDGSKFGPGDSLEFRAETLKGAVSHFHEYSAHNVYLLKFDTSPSIEAKTKIKQARKIGHVELLDSAFLSKQHHEVDTVLMRFNSSSHEAHEIWYWHKLACNDKEPFSVTLNFDDLLETSNSLCSLTFNMRGWSSIPGQEVKDHHLNVFLNDKKIREELWDGKQPYSFAVSDIPVSLLNKGANTISLQIPIRKDKADKWMIDVAILNSLEVSYPKSAIANQIGQDRFFLSEAKIGQKKWIETRGKELGLYTDLGHKYVVKAPREHKEDVAWRFKVPTQETFTTSTQENLYRLDHIEKIEANDLRDEKNQADYIVVYHPRLLEPVQPLIEAHRKRGLTVKAVNIQDIYNAFNHGIIHPNAIRSFMSYAYHQWQEPAPRYALLVGDASWDTKNAEVIDQNYADHPRNSGLILASIPSTPYEGERSNSRNLIPTLDFFNSSGHSASDSGLACVDGNDFYPDIAIGRFPVTQPDEVRAIVDKTLSYMEQKNVGPWRRNALWITNDMKSFQSQSDRLVAQMMEKDFVSDKVYPDSTEAGNEANTRRILDAFDQGQYLVYFYGHGGRFIWRTGPPDPKKNHDLFTLADLDQLAPTKATPIVLSFTCFSAPFDHPGADSIGEKFLRLPDKGAIAVIGASWRNSPHMAMQIPYMEAFSEPGTVGEAMNNAKRKIKNRTLVETYNLLGDPAVPLAHPTKCVVLDQVSIGESNRSVHGVASCLQEGHGVLDWLDNKGDTIRSEEFALHEGRFEIQYSPADLEKETRYLRVYLWDSETQNEAVGGLDLKELANKQVSTPALESGR